MVICPKECNEQCPHKNEHHKTQLCDKLIGDQESENSCPKCTKVFIDLEEMEI